MITSRTKTNCRDASDTATPILRCPQSIPTIRPIRGKALKSGKILGAGLDVLEVEKFPALGEQPWFNELKVSGKVILTPHVGGWTFDSYRKISEVLAQKLAEIKL